MYKQQGIHARVKLKRYKKQRQTTKQKDEIEFNSHKIHLNKKRANILLQHQTNQTTSQIEINSLKSSC